MEVAVETNPKSSLHSGCNRLKDSEATAKKWSTISKFLQSEKSHDSLESETNEFLRVDALLQFLISSKPSSVEEISMSCKI